MNRAVYCPIFTDQPNQNHNSAMSAQGQPKDHTHLAIIFFIFLLTITSVAIAQSITTAPSVKLSIKETLEKVQHNLPQLEAYRQQAMAAQENITLAKNSLVPDLTAG